MNNNEPIVLGQVKKGKTGKPLVVIIVFLFIGAFILFMPSIINYFGDYNVLELLSNGQLIDFIQNHDSYMNKTNIVTTTTTTKKIDKNNNVLINEKAVIKYNNFTLTNFKLESSQISFNITTSNSIDFDKSNYFLILSRDDKTLQTLKIVGTVNNGDNVVLPFNKKIDEIISIEGVIKEIKKVDYPSITLSTDESGLGSLVCKYGNNDIEYIFMNSELKSIKDTFNYIDNKDGKYLSEFTNYSNLSNELTSIGATSIVTENANGFIMNTDIDLNTYQYDKNKNNNYYSLNTKAKVVHFEMNAKGFDCK